MVTLGGRFGASWRFGAFYRVWTIWLRCFVYFCTVVRVVSIRKFEWSLLRCWVQLLTCDRTCVGMATPTPLVGLKQCLMGMLITV